MSILQFPQAQRPQQQIQQNPSSGYQFIENIGQGINQGLGMAIQDMFEEKKYQRDSKRQYEINSRSAKSIVDSMGIKGKESNSIIELLSSFSPDKQVNALKSLTEIQMYNNFLQENQQNTSELPEENTDFSERMPNSEMYELDDRIKPTNIPGVNEEEITERRITPSVQNRKNVQEENNFKNKPILPQKPKNYPPFGITAKAAEIENRRYQDEIKRNFAETKSYRETVEKQGEASERTNQTLNKLDKLIDSGKLANPLISSLAKKYDAIGLLSPETQLFEKTMGEFLPNMADTYSGRITNQHERIFLNTIPRLQQTDEGKKFLVQVLRKKNEADNIKYKVERQILKESNGIPPLNLRDLVEERSKEALERNYDQVLNIIAKGARKSNIPGHVAMVSPSGDIYDIPEDEVEEARSEEGLEIL